MRWMSILLAIFFSAACTIPMAVPAATQATPAILAAQTNTYLPVVTRQPPQGWWRPAVETSWQIQLSEAAVDRSSPAEMYIIDLFDSDPQAVAELHADGSKVVCYLSAGSWEDWRPDASQFPAEAIGLDYEGWPGEKWLDIRRIDLLGPVLRARLDLCKAKGFDGVDADNVDSYTNNTGFPLTYQDQITFNTWLASEAHGRGLAIGLKNDPEQSADLLDWFDWALTESCFDQGWCAQVANFVEAGKPVFAIEYTDTDIQPEVFCPQAAELHFNAVLKNRELDSWMSACP